MAFLANRLYACPVHKVRLTDTLFCTSCGKAYPSVNGVPILLNEENSVFHVSDYLANAAYDGASGYGGNLDNTTGLRKLYRKVVHAISETTPRKEFDVEAALEIVQRERPTPEILVIGSGDTSLSIDATYTDVAFGANVQCIADAHDLPFVDSSFDMCVAVAVLEHVIDPYRCVQEIRRVLKPGGFVYAETPFMQPVHMGAHDFTRFTYLGHRRLFRHFEEVRSGIALGPGSSAAQIVRYALTSLTDNPTARKWMNLLGLLTTFPLRCLDFLSRPNIGAYDSASGFYFFGRMTSEPLSDRELLRSFKGS